MKTARLTEHLSEAFAGLKIEADGRTVVGIALAGTESKNGYRYKVEALRAAVPLYEGRPVFIDHMRDPQRPHDRSARDLAGHVRNVRFDEAANRLRGDVVTLATESGRTFLGLAEATGAGVGMSHVVMAETNDDGSEVQKIADVLSVDAVAYPATVDSFSESQVDQKAAAAIAELAETIRKLEERVRLAETRQPTSERRSSGDLSSADAEQLLMAALCRRG